jgi:hypothetical protein
MNPVGWNAPVRDSGGSNITQVDRTTGAQTPMNPRATNVDLPTAAGRVLDFNLDGARTGEFPALAEAPNPLRERSTDHGSDLPCLNGQATEYRRSQS